MMSAWVISKMGTGTLAIICIWVEPAFSAPYNTLEKNIPKDPPACFPAPLEFDQLSYNFPLFFLK